MKHILLMIIIVSSVLLISSCYSVQNSQSAEQGTDSLTSEENSTDSLTNDDDSTVLPVETDEPSAETPEAIDFDAMRHEIFKEYPSISNISWTIDYYLEEFKLEYKALEEYWATLDFEEISAKIGTPFYTLTFEEMLDQHKIDFWSLIDPFSEIVVTMEQVASLQPGMSRTAIVAFFGGYPNYGNARGAGKDCSGYYYLEDGTILKLNFRYYSTRNKEEAGPDNEYVDGKYWSLLLDSYEIISYDDLKRDAEHEAELYPKYAVHYDPRKDPKCKLPIKDNWPEIFVTKYGMV